MPQIGWRSSHDDATMLAGPSRRIGEERGERKGKGIGGLVGRKFDASVSGLRHLITSSHAVFASLLPGAWPGLAWPGWRQAVSLNPSFTVESIPLPAARGPPSLHEDSHTHHPSSIHFSVEWNSDNGSVVLPPFCGLDTTQVVGLLLLPLRSRIKRGLSLD